MLPVPTMSIVAPMPGMAKHVNQRARGQQQEGQIRQTQCEVSLVLGEQVERGNREQEPEPDSQLPWALRARAAYMRAFPGHGGMVIHLCISLVQRIEGRGGTFRSP